MNGPSHPANSSFRDTFAIIALLACKIMLAIVKLMLKKVILNFNRTQVQRENHSIELIIQLW